MYTFGMNKKSYSEIAQKWSMKGTKQVTKAVSPMGDKVYCTPNIKSTLSSFV